MADDIKIRFAARLKKLRKDKDYTQQDLSEFADIDYKHIQRLESKRPCDVKLSTLEKLAKAFKIPITKLLKLR